MATLQEALEQALRETDAEFEIRSYSGRFMFGKTCLAVVYNPGNISPLMIGFMVAGKLDDPTQLSDSREDDMGLERVVYWPNVPYVEAWW